MPMPTTSDAASERACRALATSMLDSTRLATDSMSRNSTSFAISAAPDTHNATMWPSARHPALPACGRPTTTCRRPPPQRQRPEHQGRGGFEALVAVAVVDAGVFFGVMPCENYDEVCDQIGQGVETIGDRALRFGQGADDDLRAVQQRVDGTLTHVLRDAPAACSSER